MADDLREHQGLREKVIQAIEQVWLQDRPKGMNEHAVRAADAAIATMPNVEDLQRSNDGLLDAIERLNEGQDRLRVENEQFRQLLDLPVGEQRAAVAAYREHEQGSVEALASARGLEPGKVVAVLVSLREPTRELDHWHVGVQGPDYSYSTVLPAASFLEPGPPRAASPEHSGRAALPEEDKG